MITRTTPHDRPQQQSGGKSGPLFALRPAVVVTLILIAQWVVAMSAVSTKGITADEPAHLFGGLAIWRRDDYRFNPENGNLPQRVAAIPAWLSNIRLPAEETPHYRRGDVWTTAYQATFLTEDQNIRGPLMAGRALMALFGIGVSLMVYLAASQLWGKGGGMFALILCAACPNLLAHSPLATSDVAATLCLPLAAWLYWRMLESPSPRRIAAAAVSLGVACVVKFSAVLLGPIFVILLAIHAARRIPRTPWKRIALAQFILILSAWAIIWMAFGFQHAPGGPEGASYYRTWGYAFGPEGSLQRSVIGFLKDVPLFPEPFVYGAGYVVSSASYRLNFFLGSVGATGWPGFFPYLFLVKTPVASLLAFLGGAVGVFIFWRQRHRELVGLAPWLVCAGVYAAAALTSNLNIGHRHILPIYPALFILAGALFPLLKGKSRLLLPLLGLGAVGASAYSFPNYISYFNPIDGGPRQAWRKAVDSSLDWGQDLPAVEQWLRENRKPGETVYQAYAGCDEPDAYSIDAITLLRHPNFQRSSRSWREIRGGLYVVSATALQLELRPWTAKSEAAYPVRRAALTKLLADPSVVDRKTLERELTEIDGARLRRLGAYLRTRKPIATPGFSQLVFRLTEDEARALDHGEPLPLDYEAEASALLNPP